MGLWDKLTGEFIDIVEWLDDSNDTLVWRFERYQNEIKNGAKLVVRQQQVAIFVNEGRIADVFQSGTHELSTQNLPVLSTLKGWKYGFNSPFKAEVYFVNTRLFTDNKWGTKNPITLRDPDFGITRIRAFGNFSFNIQDPVKLVDSIVGTDGHFTLDEIHSQLKTLTVSRFTDALGESKIPLLDMAANYDELGDIMCQRINPEFADYGIGLQKFLIENISLPPAVEEAIDKRSAMSAVGDLSQYAQYQAATAMEQAAKNPGGDAGAGIGMGMGFAMANQMANSFAQPASQADASQSQAQPPAAGPASPPPIPQQTQYFLALNGQQAGPFPISQLKDMAKTGQFTAETLVWCEGMPSWQSASSTPELASIFSAMPPPIPGA